MRGHLDRIAAALADARSAGSAAGALHGGLGFGKAWPAPVAGVKSSIATMKRTKAVVRNAERPKTPVLEPPGDDDALHLAAVLLQRLIRGRAIQSDMSTAAAFRLDLVRELMTPVAEASPDESVDGSVAAMLVATIVRKLLQYASACL